MEPYMIYKSDKKSPGQVSCLQEVGWCVRARACVCVCVYVCEWMLVGFRYRVSDIYRPAMLAAHTFHHDGGHESSKLTKMDFHLEGIN